MNEMQTLYCGHCKQDKPRFLFTPAEQRKRWRTCLTCCKKRREEMKRKYGTINPHNWIMAEGR